MPFPYVELNLPSNAGSWNPNPQLGMRHLRGRWVLGFFGRNDDSNNDGPVHRLGLEIKEPINWWTQELILISIHHH